MTTIKIELLLLILQNTSKYVEGWYSWLHIANIIIWKSLHIMLYVHNNLASNDIFANMDTVNLEPPNFICDHFSALLVHSDVYVQIPSQDTK